MEVERVQAIASELEVTIPSEFIRLENEQPWITTIPDEVLEVPVIDLGGHQPDEQDTIRLVADAARDWGIFQVVNHGIPSEVISNLQKAGKEFFELPHQEKELVAKPAGSKSLEGYGAKLQKDVQGKKGWVDQLFHFIWPPSAINYKFWPKNPPSYKEAIEVYADIVRIVGDKLLELLSRGLGLEGQEFKEAVGGDNLEYLLKINYYPPCPRPDLALGVPPHTDVCALTILVPNEVQGLQVFKNGNWYTCKYNPNALIIHIGDQIEVMSNGKYKAVFHRSTVNKELTRMSWPLFLQPPPDCEVGPLPKLVNDENPAKYKTKKFKDYAYCKKKKIPQ